MKNLYLKRRTIDDPYEIRRNDNWREWLALRKNQVSDDKPFASWYCAVKSPFTHWQYEYWDCYVVDVKTSAFKVITKQQNEGNN